MQNTQFQDMIVKAIAHYEFYLQYMQIKKTRKEKSMK
jgi:hypothetical protein